MSPAVNRTDPVCGTCRRKSRKCDRARPFCRRCTTKGLVCEGYETKFKVYNIATGPKKRLRPGKSKTKVAALPSDTPTTAVGGQGEGDGGDGELSHTSRNRSCPSVTTSAMNDIFERSPSLEDLLAQDSTKRLLLHCKQSAVFVSQLHADSTMVELAICKALVVVQDPNLNPFRRYILPLAHQHASLLHAVLGLSACHISPSEFPSQSTTSISHKLFALQSISSFLLKEEVLGLTETEEDLTLSIILLLLLQDVCETGMSYSGTHLNGVAFLCSRIASRKSAQNQLRNFLVSSLAWFDMLRGTSGPEKLAFPYSVQHYVSQLNDNSLQVMIGCPTEVFRIHGEVLASGKEWLAKKITLDTFLINLDSLEQQLRDFDPLTAKYPSDDPSWPRLGDAFRHATLLRIARYPDTFSLTCDADVIKSSVNAILDSAAYIPVSSAVYKRLVFPLFMAAADTSSKHQLHYARICLDNCKKITEIKQPAMCDILTKVWEKRQVMPRNRNVPWMEFTCSKHLQRQHDHLCL